MAGDGKVVQSAAIVIAVLDDPFNDFSGECERHREFEHKQFKRTGRGGIRIP